MNLTIIDSDKSNYIDRWSVDSVCSDTAKRIIPTINRGNIWKQRLSGQHRVAKIIGGEIERIER